MICHVQKGKYGASLAFVRGCNLLITLEQNVFLPLLKIERAEPHKQ